MVRIWSYIFIPISIVMYAISVKTLQFTNNNYRWLSHSKMKSKCSMSSSTISNLGQSERSQLLKNSNANSNSNKHGSSLAVNVLVDSRIRQYLNMKNHERKTRFLLPAEITENKITNKYIRESIEKKLITLTSQPYIIRLQIPGLTKSPKQFSNDDELFSALEYAQSLGMPSIQLYVDIVPGIFPPPQHEYLKKMLDPSETNSYTLLSFYKFKPIYTPEETEVELRELWRPFKAVGRVYIASEGINAQMAIPTNVLHNFAQACQSYSLLSNVMLNTDHEVSKEQFDNNPPFKALHIRIRDQIVADGWNTNNNTNNPLYDFDWNKAGREMPPLEWHEKLDDPNAIILDCRNSYESDVGRFDKALPLNTTFFRESWPVLDEILHNTPKDAPIMTYCTGGIRCVKINAYLEQKLGFTNVARLQGGIVSYTRELAEAVDIMHIDNIKNTAITISNTQQIVESTNSDIKTDNTNPNEFTFIAPSAKSSTDSSITTRRSVQKSKFRGVNYVFDERMGSSVTEEVISQCDTCGDSSDRFTNCKSNLCHIRIIQCEKCSQKYNGCCSMYCQHTAQHPDSRSSSSSGDVNNNKNSNKSMLARQTPKLSTFESPLSSLDTTNTPNNNIDSHYNMSGSIPTTTVPSSISIISDQKSDDTDFNSMVNDHHSENSVDSSSQISEENEVTSLSTSTSVQSYSSKPIQLLHVHTQDAVNVYCDRYSSSEPILLQELRKFTENQYYDSDGALRMLCSISQGRFFTMITQLMQAKHVLELGTFTGYSALCFAEGVYSQITDDSTQIQTQLKNDNFNIKNNINNNKRVSVVTCDIDDKAISIAKEFIQKSEYSDIVEIYKKDAATVINELHANKRQFDIIFIDSDKKQYTSYIEQILSSNILKPNGLILIDNTLWKGLVIHNEEDLKHVAEDYSNYGKKDRMIKLTNIMHDFNKYLSNHPLLQPLLFPLRDGLTLVRYKGNIGSSL